MIVLLNTGAAAEEARTSSDFGICKALELVTEHEVSAMREGIKTWTDQKVVDYINQAEMREDNIKSFYAWFKEIVVTPPEPGNYTVYEIAHAEESFESAVLLGKVTHNVYLGMREEDVEKYGKLIGTMSETLYLDSVHIPYAIRHDNTRDYYWFSLHNKGVDAIDKEYARLFGRK